MSTIVIGVDASARSEDAVALARRLAGATDGRVVVVCAFPYSDVPSRSANLAYRQALKDDARATALRMAEMLSGVPPGRVHTLAIANPSPAHALQAVAEHEHAAIVVVGSTHTGRAGRVLPGATAERLLHGAPCAVAIAPDGYRLLARPAIHRVGVAYDSAEGRAAAAVAAAVRAARALRAVLEVVAVVPAEAYGAPALMGGPSYDRARRNLENDVQSRLDAIVASMPADVRVETVRLVGDPAEQLIARSDRLDLLVIGSRGYGPLHAALAGGVSGRVARAARCPLIVIPRGVKAPLGELFGAAATASA